MKTILLVLSAIIITTSAARAQESWSDSVPRVMKIAHNCPVKIRDKNGDWANFKDPLAVGRSVVGAINPRRPDMVFFQLSRDSKFMFAAARTCFEGESEWNVAQEIENTGYVEPRKSHPALFVSLDTIVDRANLTPTGGGTSTALRTRLMGACLGGSWEKRSVQWYYGFGGCFGMGKAQYKDATSPPETVYGSSKLALYGSLRGTAYYDFLTLPYAAGIELYGGFAQAAYETALIDHSITPSTSINYGAALGWRFYWDTVSITPKVVFNKFLPRNTGVEIQLAYLFGGR